MNERPIGLKEWAVAVRALEEGKMIIALRKGGIAEETRDFKLESPAFYLFPTFEHQRAELVKPAERDVVEATKGEAAEAPGMLRLTCYAEVAEDIEVTDAETLAKLDGLHIWTHDYAEERLKWKKTKPLHVLLLRIHRLEAPVDLPMRDEYNGCKSWTSFAEAVAPRKMTPVLDDATFAERVEEVRAALRN